MSGSFGDDSIVFYLRLVDETKAVREAAFSGLQKDIAQMQGQVVGIGATMRKTVVADEQAIQREHAKTVSMIRSAGEDPLQKRFGGVRGRMPVENMADLTRSLFTLEGLRQRTLSLFAGQIGTLFVYGAAMGMAAGAVRTLISAQSDMMDASAKLATALDSDAGHEKADLKALEMQARAWSLSHGQAAAEIMQAEYMLAAAGLRVNEVMQGTTAALLLAQGGYIEMKEAVDAVVIATQTFAREGLTAMHAANVLQATAVSTATDVNALQVALKYVAGTAETAGVSFEELNALLGTLANLGLRGSTAGTSLNQMLTTLVKKKNEIHELGIEIEDLEGRIRPITDILADFRAKFGSFISASESKLLKDLFEVRGGRAMERLILDTEQLPRIMGEIDKSQTEVFRAAEVGANTLSEAWKVFGNQLKNILIGNEEIGKGLQGILDRITNRELGRGLSNLTSGAAGVEFEIERLNEKMREGGTAAEDWVRKMTQSYLAFKPGALGDVMRKVRESTGYWGVGDLVIGAKQIELFKQGLEGILPALREAESLTRGGQIFKEVFGIEPVIPIRAEVAQELSRATMERQLQFLKDQLTTARRWEIELGVRLPGPLSPGLRADLEAYIPALEKRIKGMQEEQDVAAGQAVIKQLSERDKAALAANQAEIARLESQGRGERMQHDFAAQSELAKKQLAATRESLAIEAEEQHKAHLKRLVESETNTALEMERDEAERRAAGEKRTKATQDESNEQLSIRLAAIKYYYEAEDSLAKARERLILARTPRDLRPEVEERFAVDNLNRQRRNLAARLAAGGISAEDAQHETDLINAIFQVGQAERAEQVRAQNLELLQLEQDWIVGEAKMMVEGSTGRARFAAEELELEAEYAARKLIIDVKYANNKRMIEAETDKLDQEFTDRELKRRKALAQLGGQILLDSLSTTAGAFRGIASLVSATSSAARAKLLNDLAAVADAAGNTITLLSQMAAGTISGPAGWLGLIGIAAGTLATILGSGREQLREVRSLADEFRSESGRNVSADFGRAQVYNVKIELNPSFSFLGSPTPAQQKQVVDLLADDIEEALVEMGAIGGTGK